MYGVSPTEFANSLDYMKPIPPSVLKFQEPVIQGSSKIGPLGLLAQMCSSYCKEFDAIINKEKCWTVSSKSEYTRKRPRSENETNEEDPQLEPTQIIKRKKHKKLKKKTRKHKLRSLIDVSGDEETSNLEIYMNYEANKSKRFKPSESVNNESSSKLVSVKSQFEILSNSEMILQYNRSRPIQSQVSSSQVQTQTRAFEFSCSWRLQNGVPCPQRFNSSEELNEHVKYHMTSTLFSNMDYYYRMKYLVDQANTPR
jgi:hypothetical protein